MTIVWLIILLMMMMVVAAPMMVRRKKVRIKIISRQGLPCLQPVDNRPSLF